MKGCSLPRAEPSQVVVFSGHMIDDPKRLVPRFPTAAEGPVRKELAAVLAELNVGKTDLAISGGARGGDILFAELCHERGATVWLLLALRTPEYLDESVRLPNSDWEERFARLCEAPGVHVFFQTDFFPDPQDGLDVHSRNNLWMLDAGMSAASSPDALKAVLVWDEKPTGDGPGGTLDFVERVQAAGAELCRIIRPLP